MLLSALEKQQCRDRGDAELGGQVRLLVDVDFADFELSGELAGYLVHDGCDGPAWPTPRRPEIHQHRFRTLDYLLVPIGRREVLDIRTRHACHLYVVWDNPTGERLGSSSERIPLRAIFVTSL